MAEVGKISSHDLANEIISKDEDIINNIILSAEDFCLLENFDLIELLENKYGYNVNVVIYLKSQVDWLESWYNQHIKWPWMQEFSGATVNYFFNHINDFYWINYDKLLKRISKRVNRKSLYVNVMDRSGIQDVVGDFFHISI